MGWLQRILDKLKGAPGSPGATTPVRQPVDHAIIERTRTFREAYSQWVDSQRMEATLQQLRNGYHELLAQDNHVGDLFYHLDQPSAKGFMLHFKEALFSPTEFQFYFDWLKDRMLELDYRLYTSDSRTFDRGTYVEQIDRHYLKPANRRTEDNLRQVQQYGNVTLTLHQHDDRPQFIKFMCQHYSDRQYTVVSDFTQLMAHILR